MGIQPNLQTNAYIFNNSLDNTSGGAIYLGLATGGSATIENNISFGNLKALQNAGGYTMTEDYNDWGPATSGAVQVKNGSTSYNATTWMTMTGHTNDISANPMWISAPTNLWLQAGSPCMYTGSTVGLPWTGPAPDMGAVDTN